MNKETRALRNLIGRQIASRVMELSVQDVIRFDYVASTILKEFTEMSDNKIRAWMKHSQMLYLEKLKAK